jgi:hypothetical protein
MALDAGRSSVTKFARKPKKPGNISTSAGCSRRARPYGCQWPRRSRGTGCRRPQSRANICQPAPSPAPGGIREARSRAMHSRPEVRAVSGVTDNALLLGESDQQLEEAGIGCAVRDGRNSDDRRLARPAPRGRSRRVPPRYEPAGYPCTHRRREGPDLPLWLAGPGFPTPASRCSPTRRAAFRSPPKPRRRRA